MVCFEGDGESLMSQVDVRVRGGAEVRREHREQGRQQGTRHRGAVNKVSKHESRARIRGPSLLLLGGETSHVESRERPEGGASSVTSFRRGTSF